MDSMERLNYFAVLLNAKLYTLPEIKKMSDKDLKIQAEIVLDNTNDDGEVIIESLRNKPIT